MYVVSILESSACGLHVLCLSELTNVLFNSVVVRVLQCVCVCPAYPALSMSVQINVIVRTMQVKLSFLFVSHHRALASISLAPFFH
jgi:hypothetical protein